MSRPVMLAGLLGAAVGVPYAVDRSGGIPQLMSPPVETATASSSEPSLSFPPHMVRRSEIPTPEAPGQLFYQSPAPLEGIATYSLAEVLRMDVDKTWVYQRWARKSTGLAEPGLFGIRVPLVSGTRMTDVAGSLTYYYNVHNQIDRLTLTGKTADTTELVHLLVRQYGFVAQTPRVAGEQLFQVRRKEKIESELRTWPEAVLWSTTPHESFSVDLEINRPGSGRFVEPKLAPLNLPAPALPVMAAPQSQQTAVPAVTVSQSAPAKAILPPEVIVPSKEGAVTSERESTPASQSPPARREPSSSPSSQSGGTGPVPHKVKRPALRWPT